MASINASFSPVQSPDQLGGALQQGLPRPMNPKLTWSPIKTLILAGLTGGIIPLLRLPKRFGNFTTAEQLQYWHLAEWVRLQNGSQAANITSEMARRIAPGNVLRVMSLLFVILGGGIAWTAVAHHEVPVQRFAALTMPVLTEHVVERLDQIHRESVNHHDADWSWHQKQRQDWTAAWNQYYHTNGQPMPDHQPQFFEGKYAYDSTTVTPVPTDLMNAYTLAISGGALCWLFAINTHVGRVRRFVGAFNQLCNEHGVGYVRPPGYQFGLRPFWLLGVVIMAASGAIWGVPLMLAAGAHRSYIRSSSQRLRNDLARRQREVLLQQRPAVRVPTSSYLMGTCPQPKCLAPLPPEADFCRRCGTRVTTPGATKMV